MKPIKLRQSETEPNGFIMVLGCLLMLAVLGFIVPLVFTYSTYLDMKFTNYLANTQEIKSKKIYYDGVHAGIVCSQDAANFENCIERDYAKNKNSQNYYD